MESWLIRIADYLLAQSWQIAILTVAVAVASFALRNRSAHIRYLLWLIVLAKCLIPPLHSVPVAVLPPDGPKVAASAPAPIPVGRTGIACEGPQPAMSGGSRPASRGPESTLLRKPTVETRTMSIRARLAVVWIVGAAALLLGYLLKALRIQMWLHRQRRALPAANRGHIEIVELLRKHGATE